MCATPPLDSPFPSDTNGATEETFMTNIEKPKQQTQEPGPTHFKAAFFFLVFIIGGLGSLVANTIWLMAMR